MRARVLPVLVAAVLAPAVAVQASDAVVRCSVPAGSTRHMYAIGTRCSVAKQVQRHYVRALGDCGNHVCAFVAAGRDWVCHDRAHDTYDQIRCVADTNHGIRVGWRDSEY